jgi:hypothetical protein
LQLKWTYEPEFHNISDGIYLLEVVEDGRFRSTARKLPLINYRLWPVTSIGSPSNFVHNKPLCLSKIQSGFAQNGAIKKHGPF